MIKFDGSHFEIGSFFLLGLPWQDYLKVMSDNDKYLDPGENRNLLSRT